MKKIRLLVLICFIFCIPLLLNAQSPCNTGGDVSIGSGTESYSVANHQTSFMEEIYTAAEMGGGRKLHSLSLFSNTGGYTRNLAVYLMHVEQPTLEQYISLDSTAVKVFDGDINIQSGWFTFPFDTVFDYDGKSNLLLVIDNNTNDFIPWSQANSCRIFDNHSGTMLRITGYYWDFNPYSTESYNEHENNHTYYYRHQVVFGDACDSSITCLVTNLLISGFTDTSAVLTWGAANLSQGFVVEYRSDHDANWLSDTVSQSTYTLSGLMSGTGYTFRVAPLCDSGTYWKTYYFKTLCGTMSTIPFFEDFEHNVIFAEADKFFECWSRQTSPDGVPVTAGTSIPEAHGGQHFLLFPDTTGATSSAVLPALDSSISVNNLLLEFYVKSDGNSMLEVGIMTDADSFGTFQPIDTLFITASDVYERTLCPLNHYAGTGKHIAFRVTNEGNSSLYLDDLFIDYAPECLTPTHLTLDDLSAFTATLTWQEAGSASQWDIEYGPVGFTSGTGVSVSTDTCAITITGLQADHLYEFHLRSHCDSLFQSEWTDLFTFQTPCYEIDSFPFLEDFSTPASGVQSSSTIWQMPECWHRINSCSIWSGYMELQCGSSYEKAYAIMPRLADHDENGDTIDIRYLQLAFKGYFAYGEEGSISIGVMSDPSNTNTFQAVKTFKEDGNHSGNFYDTAYFYSYMGNGRYIALKANEHVMILMDDFILSRTDGTCAPPEDLTVSQIQGASAIINWTEGPYGESVEYTLQYSELGQENWQTITHITDNQVFISGLEPMTDYDVRVRAFCADSTDGSWATTSFRTTCLNGDTVNCDTTFTCTPPNMFVDNITGNEATVFWVPGYHEDSWEMEYKRAEDAVWTVVSLPVGGQRTLTGLQLLSEYTLRMRSTCAPTDTSNWAYCSFSTACGRIAKIPYYADFENFEYYASNSRFPKCWARSGNHVNVDLFNEGTTPGVSDNHCITFTHSTANPNPTAILPEIDSSIPISGLALYFYRKIPTATCSLVVGFMSDPDDIATFVPVDTLTQEGNGWIQGYVPLASYTGTGRFIALRTLCTSASGTLYIDDIELVYNTDCSRPINLTIKHISQETAELSWKSSTSTDNFTVEYGMAGFLPGTGVEIPITDTTLTLQNLLPGTEYDVYVYSLCGGVRSEPSKVSFTTSCERMYAPTSENFNSSDSFPACWTEEHLAGNLGWIVTTPTSSPSYAHSSPYAICLKNRSNISNITRLITPELDLSQVYQPHLQFWLFQAPWSGDQDTLAILYRTSPDSTWIFLSSYSQSTMYWQQIDLELPTPSTNYQIAFEGTAKYGFGIYLDDISVNHGATPPPCDTVTDLTVTETGNHHITLNWSPNDAAEYWEVRYHNIDSTAWDTLTTIVPTVTLENLPGLSTFEILVTAHCQYSTVSAISSITTSTTNVGISQLESGITLHPNPTTGQLTITSSQNLVSSVEILDLTGRTVSIQKAKENTVRVDISEFPNGVYFAKIVTEHGQAVRKVIKK